MAVALDAVGSIVNGASYSFTCTGTDRVLIVIYRNSLSTVDATAMDYAGVSLTKLGSIQYNGSGSIASFWYLVGPASGSNTLNITSAGNFRTLAISYTGGNNVKNYVGQAYSGALSDTINLTSGSADWAIEFVNDTGSLSGITPWNSSQTQDFAGDANGYCAAHKTGTANPSLAISYSGTRSGAHQAASLVAGTQVVSIPNKIYRTKQAVNRAAFY